MSEPNIDQSSQTFEYDAIIALPCYNEEKHLRVVVENLVKDCESMNVKIVILDGRSEDETPIIGQNLAEQYKNVVYLENPKRLQSAAINLAAQVFRDKAPVLIRIDAHAEYPAGYCQSLLQEQNETGAASVVVSMNTVGNAPLQKAIAVAQNSKMGNGGASHRLLSEEGKWVDHGHHALFSMNVFNELGGYDESFSHNEDAEYDYRLTKAGYKIWLTAKTYLDYYPRTSFSALFKQYYNFGKGRAKNILKHKIKPKLRQMVPAVILPTLILAVLSFIHPIFAIPLAFWMFACLGYGIYLSYQQKNLSVILSGPAAMVMHLGWSYGFWHGFCINYRPTN